MGNDSTLVSSAVVSRSGRRQARYAEVRPEALDFGFLRKGANRTLQVFIVNNRSKPISWKADTGGASWLMIDGQSSGQVQPHSRQVIDLKTNTAALDTAGTYLTTLNVVLLDTVNIHIPATIEFLGPRNVAENHIPPKSPVVTAGSQTTSAAALARQSSFSITVARGKTGSMIATVSNHPENRLAVTWNATSSESWLTLSPSFSGRLQVPSQPGHSQTIEVIADAASLAPGQYQSTLSFTATDSDGFESLDATVVTVEVTVK